MKKLSSLLAGFLLSAAAFLGLASTALAQDGATCRVNGEIVPCDQALGMLGGFLKAFGAIFGVLIVVGIISSVFWLWMLIDCLKRDFKKDNDKILWTAVIFFLHIVGAIIYYYVVKAEEDKKIK